jgi:hypothetical protein
MVHCKILVQAGPMLHEETEENPTERLWESYRVWLNDYDDMTLARMTAQTLGQLKGRVWRLSHPLIGLFRLAARTAHKRGLDIFRLAQLTEYTSAPCCGGPLLPLITRDIVEHGVFCEYCGEIVMPLDDLPVPSNITLKTWAEAYQQSHSIAHWDEPKIRKHPDFEQLFQSSADACDRLLVELAKNLLPPLLDHFPAVVWQDHDECLDVWPDDLKV